MLALWASITGKSTTNRRQYMVRFQRRAQTAPTSSRVRREGHVVSVTTHSMERISTKMKTFGLTMRLIGNVSAVELGLLLLFCASAFAADTIVYSNGPDPGNIGYWAINHGDAVTDSFTLRAPTTIHVIKFSIYDANDRNQPLTATWAITTQPFGGNVIAGGNNAPLIFYWRGFANQFLFSQWEMGIMVDITLPPGTYWLQMQNVVTRWGTWAFWGETDGTGCSPLENCPSSAYFWDALTSHQVQPVGSESFELWGLD